jgi:hypothetical protein
MALATLLQLVIGVVVNLISRLMDIFAEKRPKSPSPQSRTVRPRRKKRSAPRETPSIGKAHRYLAATALLVGTLAALGFHTYDSPKPKPNVYVLTSDLEAAVPTHAKTTVTGRNSVGRSAALDEDGVFRAPPSDWGVGSTLVVKITYPTGRSSTFTAAIELVEGIHAVVLPLTKAELEAREAREAAAMEAATTPHSKP